MPGRPLPACRRLRPRWVRISARPLASRPPWPSGCTKPWAPRMSVISWLPLLRPTRLRAYASTTPLPRPPPGSLPVWVGSPLTGRVSHPLDDKQSFMMSSHHQLPSDQPCLVAPCTNAAEHWPHITPPGRFRFTKTPRAQHSEDPRPRSVDGPRRCRHRQLQRSSLESHMARPLRAVPWPRCPHSSTPPRGYRNC